ncbi:MAG TPA: hypothetical protein DCM28_14265 [Phycisphaerales bacterium]|nr:hypothetical protein [Phycisphaerales bacterium]HCD31892.1 hypothetical protein [Phycisphaerales bacterium]|tara:strand:+ start:56 stop:295 length:240 start_codon:yes stop_codon:yes gene_type:complete
MTVSPMSVFLKRWRVVKAVKQKNPDGIRVGVRILCSMFIDSEQAPRGIAAGKPEITKKAVGAVLHSGVSITGFPADVKF